MILPTYAISIRKKHVPDVLTLEDSSKNKLLLFRTNWRNLAEANAPVLLIISKYTPAVISISGKFLLEIHATEITTH